MADGSAVHDGGAHARRPNVVLVLCDDLGYSDLGCYGGEIDTPALDRLAERGVRLAQFYNTARCSPSRASLLTGLHPHQTGLGILTSDDRPNGYEGSLNDRCVTLAEVLREAGYATCMTGKWHLAAEVNTPNDAWPTRRGFDRYFGTISGCGSYYHPATLRRGEEDAESEALRPEFYYTDAISDEAVGFIRSQAESDPGSPFFLYVAYTAPHWPLQAPEEDIAKYDGVYDAGWDKLRQRRMNRLVDLGVLPEHTQLSDRDPTQPAWDDEADQAWQARRMQVYAAQVDRMDQGVARIVAALEETGCRDDTIVIFLSDNGASGEDLPERDLQSFPDSCGNIRPFTRAGRRVIVGNVRGLPPGGEDTFASYGSAWGNLSNTPFRFYKRWVHEGGIAAPFLVSWPAGGVADGGVVSAPFQLPDVLPTLLEATGVDYPTHRRGRPVLPYEGRSMLPALHGDQVPVATQYWEHCGNAAIRRGDWKLVREYPHGWELYDLSRDRSELVDVAAEHPDLVAELSADYEAWAARVGVLEWEDVLAIYRARGLDAADAAG